MAQANSVVLLAILGFCMPSAIFAENLNITSPPVTDWGEWGRFDRCPSGLFVQGFQLKTEPFHGIFQDDSALNAIRLFCGDPFNNTTPMIVGTEGTRGNWGSVYSCYPGYINGFQLRVEPFINGDDTATNNMRVFCSNSGDPNQYLEGDGLNFGIWGQNRRCFSNQAVCGLQTQVESCSTTDDCTSLNNIVMECCDH